MRVSTPEYVGIFFYIFTYFLELDQATERLVVMDPSINTGIGRTFTFFLPSHLAVVFVALVGISGNLGTQSWSSSEKTSRLACCRMPDSLVAECQTRLLPNARLACCRMPDSLIAECHTRLLPNARLACCRMPDSLVAECQTRLLPNARLACCRMPDSLVAECQTRV